MSGWTLLQRFIQASLHLRFDSEKTWRRSTRCSFQHVGNGARLALCSAGWLTTRKFVVVVPDPIGFAPWSVLLDRGELCDRCEDTSHEAALRGQARVTSTSNRSQASVRLQCPARWGSSRSESGPSPRCGVVCLLSGAQSHVHQKGDLVLDAQEVVGMGGGQPEEQSRGTRDHPRPSQAAERRRRQPQARYLARHSCRFTSDFCDLCHGKNSPHLLNSNDGTDCVSNFDEPVKMRSSAGVDDALERSCVFCYL